MNKEVKIRENISRKFIVNIELSVFNTMSENDAEKMIAVVWWMEK